VQGLPHGEPLAYGGSAFGVTAGAGLTRARALEAAVVIHANDRRPGYRQFPKWL
jgi:hypothetical protein